VREITHGAGVDVVIDVAAGTAATILPAIDLLQPRGTLVVIPANRPLPDFPMQTVCAKSLAVKGIRGHSYQATELALRTIAMGKYPLEEVTSHRFGLGEVDQAIRAIAGEGPAGVIHAIVDPWG
jgi:threonine dehydrogenase-like Zn-dependent dehydrogenase